MSLLVRSHRSVSLLREESQISVTLSEVSQISVTLS